MRKQVILYSMHHATCSSRAMMPDHGRDDETGIALFFFWCHRAIVASVAVGKQISDAHCLRSRATCCSVYAWAHTVSSHMVHHHEAVHVYLVDSTHWHDAHQSYPLSYFPPIRLSHAAALVPHPEKCLQKVPPWPPRTRLLFRECQMPLLTLMRHRRKPCCAVTFGGTGRTSAAPWEETRLEFFKMSRACQNLRPCGMTFSQIRRYANRCIHTWYVKPTQKVTYTFFDIMYVQVYYLSMHVHVHGNTLCQNVRMLTRHTCEHIQTCKDQKIEFAESR